MAALNWLYIIPVLGLLVFVHELGHFVTARLNGIRVDEFGFGFPPRLFGVKRGGVLYSINALPIGGFVRIYGENGEHMGEPDAFGSKAPWRRALVLTAGSLMNVLLAFLIFTGLAMAGLPTERGAVVATVTRNSPAATAGLREGDEVRSIAGVAIERPGDVRTAVRPVQGQTVPIILQRDGRTITTEITPRAKPPRGQGAMGVEIAPKSVVDVSYNPVEAVGVGARQVVTFTVAMVTGIADLITGRVPADGLAGPVGIAQATKEIASQPDNLFRNLLNWTAALSLNLFLVNLLPLPALDGGRLVFVLLEAIRGKKVAPQREAFVHAMGMLLLLTFMIVISFFDVQRIIGGRSIFP